MDKNRECKFDTLTCRVVASRKKWLEIETQLTDEAINVYALTETHLRDLEKPPVIDNFLWILSSLSLSCMQKGATE